MRLWLVAVGRSRGGVWAALWDEYRRRLHWPMEVREVEVKRRTAGAEDLRRREAELLAAALPAAATVVALDERGIMLSSEAFAGRIRGWRDGGVDDLAFVIGGADGLDEGIRRRAGLVMSLGPMTWPHLLVRGMLGEQLYRAQQILIGHPYHRS